MYHTKYAFLALWSSVLNYSSYFEYIFLYTSLGQQFACQLGVKRCRHWNHRKVLGGDSTMLSWHVWVEAVPRLGHSSAEDTSVTRTDGVFVLHVCPQGVGWPVDLPTFWTWSGICCSNSHHLQLPSNINWVHVTEHASNWNKISKVD